MNTSRTYVDIEINGVNVTADISGDTTAFSYTDNAAEEADDISLTIQNRDRKWLFQWFPSEGDTVRAKIITENWTGSLNCGEFTIDDVSYSGWPLVMNLNALAIPMDGDFSGVKKNRTWSKAKLSQICGSVAGENAIPLDYLAEYDPELDFVSQTEQSDKVFLHDLCQKYGLTLKLYSTRIIVYDMAAFEKQEAVDILTSKDMTGFSCTSTIANTGYTGCVVRYTTKDGQTLEHTHSIKGKTDKIYRHSAVVASLAEAQQVAKAMLRQVNMGETTFSCTVPGDTRKVAGICVNISGFGNFDGKYLIDRATHSVGGGYKTSLECHRVMLDD